MSDMMLDCPECGGNISANLNGLGFELVCPNCSKTVPVPWEKISEEPGNSTSCAGVPPPLPPPNQQYVQEATDFGPSVTDVKWLNAFNIRQIPATSSQSHQLTRDIRNRIGKALGSVFINLPFRSGEREKVMFAAIYSSEYYDQIPFRPEDRWDSVELSDELQLKIIRTVEMHLSEREFRSLRIRKLKDAKGCWASSFVEVSFSCPSCGQELLFDSNRSGTTDNCTSCNAAITVPAPVPRVPKGRRRHKRQFKSWTMRRPSGPTDEQSTSNGEQEIDPQL